MLNRGSGQSDGPCKGFQYLEDLATAYWFSETIFAAIELGIFELIEKKRSAVSDLAVRAGCHEDELARMLMVVSRMELIEEVDGQWCNSPMVSKYLTKESPSYLGDFLLYRKYMQAGWQTLLSKVSKDSRRGTPIKEGKDYSQRTYDYVKALDQLARQKAKEIVKIVNAEIWQPPLLDLGGGAGALGRAFIASKTPVSGDSAKPLFRVDLLELAEVISAAKEIYRDALDWQDFQLIEGDFRNYQSEKKYGLILVGNFLHTYSREEAGELLAKIIAMLTPQGMVLIHDYFPDRLGQSPLKGPIYDIAMMLNTYNGRCHQSAEIFEWLKSSGMGTIQICDLGTDSSVVAAVMAKEVKGKLLLTGEGSAK